MADSGGRYRKVRLLGTGGTGEVWLALDEELGDKPGRLADAYQTGVKDSR